MFEIATEGECVCVDSRMNENDLYSINALNEGYRQQNQEYYEVAADVRSSVA